MPKLRNKKSQNQITMMIENQVKAKLLPGLNLHMVYLLAQDPNQRKDLDQSQNQRALQEKPTIK